MLEVRYVETGSLKPNHRNARTHPKKQIRQIAHAITNFGFVNPILIDEAGGIIAGHGRLAAAQLLAIDKVPVIEIAGLSEAKKRALMLADNRLALNSAWNEVLLAEELEFLIGAASEIDVGVTGFDISEVDILIDGQKPEDDGDPCDDQLPKLRDRYQRVKRGQIWKLGPHRLACGDARDRAIIATLMDGESAQMAFADPPYNIRISGNVSRSKKANHREFEMGSGELSKAEFTAFLSSSLASLAEFSRDGAILFVCMDWRHLDEILEAGRNAALELKNLIVWAKDNAGMGSFYRSRHELIFAFKSGTAPHVNAFELGQHGRYRSNLWQYKGTNSFKAGRKEELEIHPTTKPVQMIADAIRDVSARGDVVLDLFAGSGSTLIAAHKTGRRAFVCEIDPIYCDRIIARWEIHAKDEAELISFEIEGIER